MKIGWRTYRQRLMTPLIFCWLLLYKTKWSNITNLNNLCALRRNVTIENFGEFGFLGLPMIWGVFLVFCITGTDSRGGSWTREQSPYSPMPVLKFYIVSWYVWSMQWLQCRPCFWDDIYYLKSKTYDDVIPNQYFIHIERGSGTFQIIMRCDVSFLQRHPR